MDGHPTFVLLIQKDPFEAALIRQALMQPAEGALKLQCVESIPTALARVCGGGVDVIMLDLSLHEDRSRDSLGGFLLVRQAAPRLPIIVLYDPRDEGLALRAMRAGAADYLPKEGPTDEKSRAIRSAIELVRNQRGSGTFTGLGSRPAGGTISFIGAKGGVGATTVALNIASVLARRSRVILAEMRPAFGTLLPYLKPNGQIRNISQLVGAEATDIGPAELSACLWPCKTVPGLRVYLVRKRPESVPSSCRAM
jgi:CheY-like chemotaxis protein